MKLDPRGTPEIELALVKPIGYLRSFVSQICRAPLKTGATKVWPHGSNG
jgi:hypothetical protein